MDLTDIDVWDVEALDQLSAGLEGVLVAHRVRDIRRRLTTLRKEAVADDLHIRQDGTVSAVAPIADGHPLHVHAQLLEVAVRELIGEALLVSVARSDGHGADGGAARRPRPPSHRATA
ncbi:hypothetical protein ABT116_48300, partial [Streptomyces sp. NPDC002130]|uniref:hypothetical protein n=1 Tax=Streptomyces sp. NPDC002130 TaxID=3155568 RepID=UPI003321147B